MASQWTVILLDNRPGHSRDEVDITRRVNMRRSTFQPTAQGLAHPSDLWVTFPKTVTNLLIQEGMEVWAGHRDPVTREWDSTHPVYGGYIGVQTGKGRGTRRRLPLQVDEYDFDLDTTAIDDIWPDVVSPGNGIPVGKSATDWLVGDPITGTAYSGLITQYLAGGPGVDLTGVDSAFDSIIFSTSAMPGLAAKEYPTDRYYGVTMLRAALDNIIDVIKFYADTMDPVAYMEPVIDSTDPTRIRPRFRLADRNSTAGSVWATYSSEPISGEYWIFNASESFGHTRDNRESRQRIIVKGAGTQTTGTATPGDLVMGVAYDGTRNIQRTTYQTKPGRALIYQSDDLGDKADCEQLASRFESLLYGAIGRLVLPVDHYAPPGAIIQVNIPEEGQNYAKYRVNEVNALPDSVGHPMWELIVGAERPDLANLFTRLSNYLSGVRQLQKLGLKPGAVPSSPTYSNPIHSQQNVQQAQADDVTARTTKPGFVRPGDTRTTTTVYREQHVDPTDVPREWIVDGSGTGHPHHYGGIISASTTVGTGTPVPPGSEAAFITIADDDVVIRRVEVRQPNGGAIAWSDLQVQYSSGGVVTVLTTPPTSSTPHAAPRGQVISVAYITAGGTPPTYPLTVLLSEAP